MGSNQRNISPHASGRGAFHTYLSNGCQQLFLANIRIGRIEKLPVKAQLPITITATTAN